MRKNKSIVIVLTATIFFAVAIPIIINEIYKYGSLHGGYVTIWDAPEVLSYYGTLLGAGTTVVALVFTIAFTKKQIRHDSFLDHNYARWEKVESAITQILMDVSPLNMCNFEKLSGPITESLHIIISNLLRYEATTKTSLDIIKCYINSIDYREIADFVTELYDSTTQFCKIGQELLDEYLVLQNLALENGGLIPDPELLKHLARATEINKKIPQAHDVTYQKLLNKKRKVFEKIYADIELQADEILQFRKRKKDRHAHT